jgi:glutamate racemase
MLPATPEPVSLRNDGPIGVLDSGVGGLSILRALRQELPHEAFLYVADQAHLPYGPRPLDEIRAFVHAITGFLLAQRAKTIVVACNAASAAGLLYLRETFPHVPFVGMEPAVKPAAEATRSGAIGVLTTAATARGPLYARVIDRYARNVRVETVVCPELVHAVENGQTDLTALRPLFERRLAPLLEAGIDQLALACTHFPFVAEAIRTFLGPAVAVIDPSPAIARQTRRVLVRHSLLNEGGHPAMPRYFTTGDPVRFAALAGSLLGETVPCGLLLWSRGALSVADAPPVAPPT